MRWHSNFFEFQEECLSIIRLNLDRNVLDKQAIFLENKTLYEKILFYIFRSVFHVESPSFRLYHQSRAILYINYKTYKVSILLLLRHPPDHNCFSVRCSLSIVLAYFSLVRPFVYHEIH